MRFPASLLLLALVPACGGALRGTVVAGPEDTPGFPEHADDGVVIVEATFYGNHPEIFGTDLVSHGTIPIAIRIGVRDRDGVVRRLSADTLDAHLYLQDGTPLSWIPYDQIDEKVGAVLQRIARRALPLSVLPDWKDAPEAFLFFRYGDDLRISGTNVLTPDGGYYRELDLLQSLISLNVSTPKGPTRLYVGLRSGRFAND